MTDLDPRLHAFRPDLAAAALRPLVKASRYSEGHSAQITRGVADLRRRPAASAPLDTQLLFGETVRVYDQADGWSWVQNDADGYVGYLDSAALRTDIAPPTHEVAVARTFLYPEPDLKAPTLDALSFMSGARVVGTRGRFSEVRLPGGDGGWIFSAHLADRSATEADFVKSGLLFLGAPYLWGGRSSLGLDCSALVQLALARAGIPCPRDSGAQEKELGTPVPWKPGATGLRRGDLIYFPGHVAIALDETRVLNANAGAMLTTIEPLAALEGRVRQESGGRGITAVRRLRA